MQYQIDNHVLDSEFLFATEQAYHKVCQSLGKDIKQNFLTRLGKNFDEFIHEVKESVSFLKEIELDSPENGGSEGGILLLTHTSGISLAVKPFMMNKKYKPILGKRVELFGGLFNSESQIVSFGRDSGVKALRSIQNGYWVTAAIDYYYPGQRMTICPWFNKMAVTISGIGKIALLANVDVYIQVGDRIYQIFSSKTGRSKSEYEIICKAVSILCQYSLDFPDKWLFWGSLNERWALAEAYLKRYK